MLQNVWSVAEFQRKSKKIFGSRSSHLIAIDQALATAHGANTATMQGAETLIKLVEAITKWQQAKIAKNRKSSRAEAVGALLEQVSAVCEKLYKDKARQQNALAKNMHDLRAKNMPQPGVIPKGAGKMPGLVPKGPLPGTRPYPKQPLTLPFTSPAQRPPEQDRLFDMLAQAMLKQRQKVMAFDDEDLFEDLDVAQKGRLAANWMLAVPDGVTDVNAAKGEALRILGAMLGNNVSVIRKLFSANMEVVVVPRDQGMSMLDQFESIRGQKTFDGRSWDSVRGVGNVVPSGMGQQIKNQIELRGLRTSGKKAASVVVIDPAKGRIYTAITEENLLGGNTTAPGGGCYATGYSTSTHEFAHAIHGYGLSPAERKIIDDCFALRTRQGDGQEWVDGPRKVGAKQCYSSMNAFEYWAQLTNAWLGTNKGTDPYTGRPRNNGKEWVIANEPRPIADLLEKVYGRKALDDLNPAIVLTS